MTIPGEEKRGALPSSPARSKEVAQERGAFGGPDSTVRREAMVQAGTETLARERRDCAHLRIGGAEDERGDSGMDHRSHAHQAGLERYVEGRTGEPVVAGAAAGASQGEDLRVGG